MKDREFFAELSKIATWLVLKGIPFEFDTIEDGLVGIIKLTDFDITITNVFYSNYCTIIYPPIGGRDYIPFYKFNEVLNIIDDVIANK